MDCNLHRLVRALLVASSLAGAAAAQIQEQEFAGPVPSLGYASWSRIDGTTAVVTDPTFPARAEIYEFDGVQWNLTLDLPFGGDGLSADVWGDWIAFGRQLEDPAGRIDAGQVHVFQRGGASGWQLVQLLSPADAAPGDHFGAQVVLRDGVLVVGAVDVDHPSGAPTGMGAAYVFELDSVSGLWTETTKLLPSVADKNQHYGWGLAYDQDTILIGGLTPSSPGVPRVTTFERSGGVWQETGMLVPSSGSVGNSYGLNLAIDGDWAAVGAHGEGSSGQGRVHLFQRNGTWSFVQTLVPPYGNTDAQFGNGVAMSAEDLIVGAPGEGEVAVSAGAAYHFRLVSGAWEQVGKLISKSPAANASIGSPVDLSGATVIAGDVAFFDNGSVAFFTLGSSATQYCSCAVAGACANMDIHGGCRNSGPFSGAVLQAGGSGSVASDDLRLETRFLPAASTSVGIYGSAAQSTPFGDGLLCVAAGSGGIHRLPPQVSAADGSILYGPGLATQNQFLAGEARYFQTWYRDVNGPCGTKFNLSNGLEVVFTP